MTKVDQKVSNEKPTDFKAIGHIQDALIVRSPDSEK